MSKGKKTLLIIAALVALMFGGYKWWYSAFSPVYSWHQKYILEIETPDGMKSGSSVVGLSYEKFDPSWNVGNVHYFNLTGEASVVDLGGGRYLFALVTRNGMEYAAFSALAGKFGLGKAAYEKLAPKIAEFKGKIDLRNRAPLLVTFTDISDPKTVKRVDSNDLAASFGAGYALKSITLEITDEPVTKGVVEEVLVWLEAVGRNRSSLIPYPKGMKSTELTDPQIQLLSPSTFSTELYK